MLTYAAASHQVKVTISETVKTLIKGFGMAMSTTQETTQETINLYNVMGELVKTTEAAGNTDEVSTAYTYDSQGFAPHGHCERQFHHGWQLHQHFCV